MSSTQDCTRLIFPLLVARFHNSGVTCHILLFHNTTLSGLTIAYVHEWTPNTYVNFMGPKYFS